MRIIGLGGSAWPFCPVSALGAQSSQLCLGGASPSVPAPPHSGFICLDLAHGYRPRTFSRLEHLQEAQAPRSHVLNQRKSLLSPAIEIVLPLPLRARLTPLSRPVTACFRKQGKRSCSSAVTPSPVGHILAPCCPAIRHRALVLCVWCFLGGKPSCVLNASCVLRVDQKACQVALRL